MPLSDSLREALVQRAWAQWIALGVLALGPAEQQVIDPEALVALTAELKDTDARLRDTSTDWCIAYGRFISATRLRRVAEEIGSDPVAMGEYAGTVAAAGGPRWPMATDPRSGYRNRGKAHLDDLDSLPRLILRLRAAFGVNARADVLATLALRPGSTLTLADLAGITRFTKRNVALTVDALALSGIVELEEVGNQRRVSLRRDRLGLLLPAVEAEPVEWVDRLRIGLTVLQFLNDQGSMKQGVRAIEARALARNLQPAIRRARLPKPDFGRLGASFGDAFDEWIEQLRLGLGTGDVGRDAKSVRSIAAFFELEPSSADMARLTGLSPSTLDRLSRGDAERPTPPADAHLSVLAAFVDEAGELLRRTVEATSPSGSGSMRDWLHGGWVRTSRGKRRPIEALADRVQAVEALDELRRATD